MRKVSKESYLECNPLFDDQNGLLRLQLEQMREQNMKLESERNEIRQSYQNYINKEQYEEQNRKQRERCANLERDFQIQRQQLQKKQKTMKQQIKKLEQICKSTKDLIVADQKPKDLQKILDDAKLKYEQYDSFKTNHVDYDYSISEQDNKQVLAGIPLDLSMIEKKGEQESKIVATGLIKAIGNEEVKMNDVDVSAEEVRNKELQVKLGVHFQGIMVEDIGTYGTPGYGTASTTGTGAGGSQIASSSGSNVSQSSNPTGAQGIRNYGTPGYGTAITTAGMNSSYRPSTYGTSGIVGATTGTSAVIAGSGIRPSNTGGATYGTSGTGSSYGTGISTGFYGATLTTPGVTYGTGISSGTYGTYGTGATGTTPGVTHGTYGTGGTSGSYGTVVISETYGIGGTSGSYGTGATLGSYRSSATTGTTGTTGATTSGTTGATGIRPSGYTPYTSTYNRK